MFVRRCWWLHDICDKQKGDPRNEADGTRFIAGKKKTRRVADQQNDFSHDTLCIKAAAIFPSCLILSRYLLNNAIQQWTLFQLPSQLLFLHFTKYTY